MVQPNQMIVTSRLLLRSLIPSDFRILYKHVLSDAAVMAVALSGRPMSLSQSRQFIERNFDHEGSGKKLGVLTERATEQVFGFAGLLQCEALGEPDYELGFVLRRSAWGLGYATEIGRGQLDYGFNVLGLTRMLALVSPKNDASINALEKIGMKFCIAVDDTGRGDRHVYIARNNGVR